MNIPTHASTGPAKCISCRALSDGFCNQVNALSLAPFSERSQLAHYKQCVEILPQGERADRIGIIRSGLVKVVMLNEDGDHQVLQVLKPGQIVGDAQQFENIFSWETATSAEICWIQRSTIDLMLRETPQLHSAVLNVVAQQLEQHRLWDASMRGRNTVQRIAFWIMQQVPDLSDGSTAVFEIALTRRDLASLLDMTVETLCRGLYQLSDRDAVRLLTPEKIEIRNIIKLRLVARCSNLRVSDKLSRRDQAPAVPNPFCISDYSHSRRHQHMPMPRESSSNLFALEQE